MKETHPAVAAFKLKHGRLPPTGKYERTHKKIRMLEAARYELRHALAGLEKELKQAREVFQHEELMQADFWEILKIWHASAWGKARAKKVSHEIKRRRG